MSKKRKIVGGFVGCGLEPKGIIAMDFGSLKQAQEYVAKLENKPTHWCLSGMCDDELTMLYEEKDGQILKNLFD
jgi:hypothetical protein